MSAQQGKGDVVSSRVAGSDAHAVSSVAPMRDAEQAACLIVNADDYGYYDCVSRGILHAAQQGIVTATGVLATSKRLDAHVGWLAGHAGLDLGIHLNLTDREPLTATMRRRLDRSHGRFPSKFIAARAVLSGVLPPSEVKHEWRAQIERCLDKGLTIRFLNSHEHIHMLPALFRVTQELAHEYGIAHVRLPAARGLTNWRPGPLVRDVLMSGLARLHRARLDPPAPTFLGIAESGRLGLDVLCALIPAMKAGTVYELMCHPGFRDDHEIDNPRLYDYHDWEGELTALTSPEVRALLDRHGVRLIGYRDLENRDGRWTLSGTA